MPFSALVCEGLSKTPRHCFWQFDLADMMACALEQHDGVLGESQEVELLFPIKQERQQRLEMEAETETDHYALPGGVGKVIDAKHVRRAKHRDPITLVPPKQRVLYQCLDWFQHFLNLSGAEATGQQAPFSLAE
ncbi:MAG: hypothetical protein ABI456_01170 [Ktedonobacteraceae bacterium]|nr:hypothetical protein [Chloroflexota bacterium]